MKIHREGYATIAILGTILLLINLVIHFSPISANIAWWTTALSALFLLFIISFFRLPRLKIAETNLREVLAPADGRIVVIEETHEPEYFADRRLQISIFMSPANVHVNRTPISGVVKYTQYHPGSYLVAWHPKSSTENERFTSVIENATVDAEILVRQIAGKLARKISNYLDEGEEVQQGEELGFIKLGSRVDIFLPLGSKVNVTLNQKVRGGKTIIAELL